MKTRTTVCGIAAALVAGLCLSPGLAPEAWAQTQPGAATDAADDELALALRARGAWSPGVNYVKDDLVTARGSAWRAKRANINKVPGSTAPSTALDWERFAAGLNPLGVWLSTTTYHRDDLVLRLGATWRALRTNLNKAPGLFPANWEQFAARGAAGGNSVANGSAGAPAINFSSDPSTGIFSPSTGKIAMSAGGTLFLHNIGTDSTALGAGALDSSSGTDNTALGSLALTANTNGDGNTAVGSTALASNSTGSSNTALGFLALANNGTGVGNTAVGSSALQGNFSGNSNIGIGQAALGSNQISSGNVAIGSNALVISTGANNTAVGDAALLNNTTGSGNIALGANAGVNADTPSNSIFIGNQGLAGTISTIRIGTQGTQTTAFMAGISGVTVASSAAVLINTTTGQLGTVFSSRRYKEDIEPMADASAPLLKLRPVTFRYTKPYDDGGKPIQYGLIAEEVAEVLPELAVFNQDGSPETVKYHLLPSLLLNEVQGQQKTIERQEQTIKSQAEQIAALERRLSSLEAMLVRSGTAAGLPRPVSLTRAAP